MKQPKRPTLTQKRLIVECGLNPNDWMVRMEDKAYLHICNKQAGCIRILDKQLKRTIVSQAEKSPEPTKAIRA